MYDLPRKKKKLSFSPSCFLTLSTLFPSLGKFSYFLVHKRDTLLDHHSTTFSIIYIYIYIYTHTHTHTWIKYTNASKVWLYVQLTFKLFFGFNAILNACSVTQIFLYCQRNEHMDKWVSNVTDVSLASKLCHMWVTRQWCDTSTNYVTCGSHVSDIRCLFIYLFTSLTVRIYLSYGTNIRSNIELKKSLRVKLDI